jgi:hypothetical protein
VSPLGPTTLKGEIILPGDVHTIHLFLAKTLVRNSPLVRILQLLFVMSTPPAKTAQRVMRLKRAPPAL